MEKSIDKLDTTLEKNTETIVDMREKVFNGYGDQIDKVKENQQRLDTQVDKIESRLWGLLVGILISALGSMGSIILLVIQRVGG